MHVVVLTTRSPCALLPYCVGAGEPSRAARTHAHQTVLTPSRAPGVDDADEADPGQAGTWIFALSLVALTACVMAYLCRYFECMALEKEHRARRAAVGGMIGPATRKVTCRYFSGLFVKGGRN